MIIASLSAYYLDVNILIPFEKKFEASIYFLEETALRMVNDHHNFTIFRYMSK